mmetsp:Transcript_4524/g.7920  ORF Transcript_4524/g.7920 Transcript_4524/m.7920 type:complete len:515 (-) Transcript_4524:2001-3545(-)
MLTELHMIRDSIGYLFGEEIASWSAPRLFFVGCACIILLLVVLEQLRFFNNRRCSSGDILPGRTFALPFIGDIIHMVLAPMEFWDTQRLYHLKHGISWMSLFGKYSIIVSDPKTVRTILNNNGDHAFSTILHPNGHTLLGPGNIAFISGPGHKRLRRSFLTLFTRKALSVYLHIQESKTRDALIQMLKENPSGKEFEVRNYVRDLNLKTSQAVFVGPYIRDQDAFSKDYLEITLGFLCFPICFPGTQLYSSVQARKRVIHELTHCAKESKKYIAQGGEPRCLLDFWSQRILEELKLNQIENDEIPEYSSDFGMGEVMLDFLFASQDASTASLAWIFTLMADNPSILEKVRHEQASLRPNSEPLTFEIMERMVYTRAVVLEILRYRAPAIFVPQVAKQNYKLTEDYTVPKGTLVFPSLIDVCHQGFPNPECFEPERMLPPRNEHIQYRENYLPFGIGPHGCVGREYAINHMMTFLAVLSTECTWTRRRTEISDDIVYLPTIYPADSLITMKARVH